MLYTPSKRRRIVNIALLLGISAFSVYFFRIVEVSLLNTNEWSGWTLLAGIVLLIFYAARKRMSTLPLGRVAIWLQLHIYLGLFCLFVFAQHIHWSFPEGLLEIALSISFIGTIITGLLGLYWSRSLPTRLTRIGDEVLYERIPELTVSLRELAQQKIIGEVESSGSHALADFYQSSGHKIFARPSFQIEKLYGAHSAMSRVERELDSAKLFMTEDEREIADQLASLIRQKDGLDTHYTLQGALKHWLFVHFAFSLSMLPLIGLHIFLVYSFALT